MGNQKRIKEVESRKEEDKKEIMRRRTEVTRRGIEMKEICE